MLSTARIVGRAVRPMTAGRAQLGLHVARGMSTSTHDLDGFVQEALAKCELGEFADGTIQALREAQVLNTNLLFKLTDADFKAAGVSIGASRALKEAITEAKRSEVVARAGERANIRRALSMKEKRKL
mmetsp:Transcript_7455/g.11748  ORF Transcript_7455/g.11748 Transcript_7455/m.11748 type:complete len:128 (-) Transcript_7455:315-698(-)